MTEIVPATKEEFEKIRAASSARFGQPMAERTARMLALEVGEAMRIVKHDHRLFGKAAAICTTTSRVQTAARLKGRKIRTTHDGADLLVMRVK